MAIVNDSGERHEGGYLMNKAAVAREKTAGRNRRKRAARRKTAGSRAGMLAIVAVVSVLVLVLFIKGESLKAQIAQNKDKAAALNTQIEDEKDRTEEIEALKDYYQSDDYVREVAQERLGLVGEGQIVFRSAD